MQTGAAGMMNANCVTRAFLFRSDRSFLQQYNAAQLQTISSAGFYVT
jgi:hypothetical protein